MLVIEIGAVNGTLIIVAMALMYLVMSRVHFRHLLKKYSELVNTNVELANTAHIEKIRADNLESSTKVILERISKLEALEVSWKAFLQKGGNV